MAQLAENLSGGTFRHPGELIRYTRRRLGLSQQQVADEVKMSASGLSKVESGKHILPRKAIQICERLKISPNQLAELSSKVIDSHQKKALITTLDELKKNVPNWKDLIIEGIKELM